MKKMKPFLRPCYQGGEFFGYVDLRTMNMYEDRWWTRARVPGTVRLSRMPGGSGHRPVKYGARKARNLDWLAT